MIWFAFSNLNDIVQYNAHKMCGLFFTCLAICFTYFGTFSKVNSVQKTSIVRRGSQELLIAYMIDAGMVTAHSLN